MAVIPSSVILSDRGATGSYDRETGYTARAEYKCQTDDLLDTFVTVTTYFLANVAAIGDSFAYGNDSIAYCRLRNVEPQPQACDAAGNRHWIVVLDYREDNDDRDFDDGGNPTEDPLSFAATLDIGSTVYERPAEKLEYQGGYGAGLGFTPGTTYTPQTSAGQPYTNPPLSELTSDGWLIFGINLTRGFANVDAIKQYEGYIDTTGFQFNVRGLVGSYQPYQMRMRDISVVLNRFKNTDYATVQWTMEQAPEVWNGAAFVRTWDYYVPSLGVMRRQLPGDPEFDEEGNSTGTVSTSPDPARAPIYVKGVPVVEPEPLDLDGQTTSGDPAIGQWRSGKVTAFKDIPGLSSILSALPP
jgi:hypothetical protein